MMLADAKGYLTDDILVKLDRASMAVGLEARVPFLDHRIAEFAWSLPDEYKFSRRSGKRILRTLLHRSVPEQLLSGPKKGFSIPLDRWLRGPWKDFVGDYFGRPLDELSIVDGALVRQRWAEHVSGKRNWEGTIWAIFSLLRWMEAQRNATRRQDYAVAA